MVEMAGVDELSGVYYEAVNIVRQVWRRERDALCSLERVACEPDDKAFLGRTLAKMQADEQHALQDLDNVAKKKCQLAGIDPSCLKSTPADPEWAALVPRRVQEIRGPINLHRYQYGRRWLYEQLGEYDFEELLLTQDGLYYTYEALNFVDGKRTIREIRDIVCAEYEPAPVEHFYEFLTLLNRAGAVQFAE
jgi:hypothetical protein